MLPERRQDLVLSGTCHWLHEPEAGGLHVAVHNALVGQLLISQSSWGVAAGSLTPSIVK